MWTSPFRSATYFAIFTLLADLANGWKLANSTNATMSSIAAEAALIHAAASLKSIFSRARECGIMTQYDLCEAGCPSPANGRGREAPRATSSSKTNTSSPGLFELVTGDPFRGQTQDHKPHKMTQQHTVKEYFPHVPTVTFEGPGSKNPLAFQEYNASEVIMGKSMHDWCRFAVCYWHTFGGNGSDPFGPGTFTNRAWDLNHVDGNLDRKERILESAKCKADAAFELFTKLGVKFYTFHDHDLIDEGANLTESQVFLDEISEYLLAKQQATGVKCLWGTSNLFGHRRFMNGASTNPDMAVFAHAAAHVKKAMEITLKLGGENFVFWGGREGYQSILNTNTRKELDHMAAFFKMVVAYKAQIGATFQLLIEPKPREPMKHQYDYDAATCVAFLHYYGLEQHFKLNIEPNHTTLAGHDYEHDIYYSADYGMLGSVDCNTGDPLLGWDTDQFLMDEKKALLVMKKVVEIGGLAPGGLNFDCKVRRESSELEDLFIAHIGSMDCFARGLRQAAKLLADNELPALVDARYASWKSDLGERIEAGKSTLEEVAAYAREVGEPQQRSGKQELAEMLLFRSITK